MYLNTLTSSILPQSENPKRSQRSSANVSKRELCEIIKQKVPNFTIMEAEIGVDPDQRNHIVSNEKLEATGWKPEWDLDRGIQELIMAYQMIVPKMGAEFRNGFPLGYANNM